MIKKDVNHNRNCYKQVIRIICCLNTKDGTGYEVYTWNGVNVVLTVLLDSETELLSRMDMEG